MSFPKYTQDPEADLDYKEDWTAWLAGDTIVSSSWSCDDAAITLHDDAFDASVTTVFARGGVVGQSYTIINHIVTALGREDDRSRTLKIKET